MEGVFFVVERRQLVFFARTDTSERRLRRGGDGGSARPLRLARLLAGGLRGRAGARLQAGRGRYAHSRACYGSLHVGVTWGPHRHGCDGEGEV